MKGRVHLPSILSGWSCAVWNREPGTIPRSAMGAGAQVPVSFSFPDTSRKLYQKWSTWDLNQHSYGMQAVAFAYCTTKLALWRSCFNTFIHMVMKNVRELRCHNSKSKHLRELESGKKQNGLVSLLNCFTGSPWWIRLLTGRTWKCFCQLDFCHC